MEMFSIHFPFQIFLNGLLNMSDANVQLAPKITSRKRNDRKAYMIYLAQWTVAFILRHLDYDCLP